MSAAATAPAAPVKPDPDRAVPARLDPAGTGKILRLLRTLFAYGRNLVETLRQEHDPDDLPWYAFLTSIFGTTDPALITVLIIRGLLRLAALRARLCKGVSFPSLPVQQNRAATRIDRATGPGPREPRAAGWVMPPGWPARDQFFDRLPAPEEEMLAEIVAEDHDRPIGAILLDICRDLGIAPAQMDPAVWDELRLAITLYGGDPTTLEACGIDSADPAGLAGVERKSGAHAAIGTPGPNGSPPIIGYPPWPAPPEQPPPLAGGGWGRGPGP